MKAAVLYANRDIRFEEYPEKELKSGDVRVKIRTVGICGSDVPRVLHGGAHFYPIVLGHEFSGEVVGLSDSVKDLEIGDRVAGVPLLPCMKCGDCQKGNYSLCKNYSFIGSREQGAFSEYIVVPQKNVVKFDSSVSFEMGAFFEPITVAMHGILCNDYVGGKDVVVLGGGTIGLITMQLCQIMGAKSVTVLDIVEERLCLAKKLGATHAVNTLREDFSAQIKEVLPRGFDYVFETAGNVATMKLSFELAANKAHICFIGTPTKDLTFTPKEFEAMNRKEFKLTGSWMSYSAPFPGVEWELAAHYLKTGQLKIDSSFIFKRFPLSEAAQGFALFENPQDIKGKVMLINE